MWYQLTVVTRGSAACSRSGGEESEGDGGDELFHGLAMPPPILNGR